MERDIRGDIEPETVVELMEDTVGTCVLNAEADTFEETDRVAVNRVERETNGDELVEGDTVDTDEDDDERDPYGDPLCDVSLDDEAARDADTSLDVV